MPNHPGPVELAAAAEPSRVELIRRPRAVGAAPFVALGLGALTFAAPFVMPVDPLTRQLREDSVLEYLQAALFLAGSVCFLLTYWFADLGVTLGRVTFARNPFLLAIGLVLAFGTGEELSWGQRIFEFDTPDLLADANVQREFTIHNISWFDSTTGSVLKMDRLFHGFWFTIGIVIPAFDRYSAVARHWMRAARVPVFPLALSAQFLLFYLLGKMYIPLGVDPAFFGSRLTELRETAHALIFALIGLSFCVPAWSGRTGAALNARTAVELTGTRSKRAV
jgi:hypothetical protein